MDRRITIAIFIFISNLRVAVKSQNNGSPYFYSGHGHRLIILVAFSDDYTLSNFIENLQHFATSFNCAYRQQFISIYFGDQSMQLECEYQTSLIDCVKNRLLSNTTLTNIAHKAALYNRIVDHTLYENERNITETILQLIATLVDEYYHNIYTNGSYITNSIMLQKKFIFLTNFFSECLSKLQYDDQTMLGTWRILAIYANDYIQSQALFLHDIQQTIWNCKLIFDKNGIDRHLSSKVLNTIYIDFFCVNLQNNEYIIGAPFAPTQLLIYVSITNVDDIEISIIVDFIRQLTTRLSSTYCTRGFNATTTRDILFEYLMLLQCKMFANDNKPLLLRMPWTDRQSFDAYAQMMVDDKLSILLTLDNPSHPSHKPSNATAQQLPIYTICDGDFSANFNYYLTKSPAPTKRIIIVSNVAYSCLPAFLTIDVPLSEYLTAHPDTVIDYVYFNSRPYENTFTNADLYQSLSGALPQSNDSSNHLYFIKSMDDMNKAFDQISFCADQMVSSTIIDSLPTSKKQQNIPNAIEKTVNITVVVVGSIALLLAGIAAILITLQKYLNRKRNKFIRQVKINERHQFDYIQTLWKVPEKNVAIDYNRLIGKGVQSVVYQGRLNQKSPIIDIFDSQNLSHFENCTIAVKMARDATDVYHEQTLNEIRICSRIGYHWNICTMLGFVSSEHIACLLLELADTNLLNALASMKDDHRRKMKNTQDIVKYLNSIAVQIANGMLYIALKNLVHRDLAARNVLITTQNRAMITDFGLCVECEPNGSYVQEIKCPMPIKWLAYESLNENRFSEKSDVWSFGVVLFEIFSLGEEPYSTIPVKQLKSFLSDGKRMNKPVYADVDIYELMVKCWKEMPDERLPFEEIKRYLVQHLDNYEIFNSDSSN